VAGSNGTAIGARNRQEKEQEEQDIQVLQEVTVRAQIDTRSRRQTTGRQDRELDPELGTTSVVH
jgi:hypothetical protein